MQESHDPVATADPTVAVAPEERWPVARTALGVVLHLAVALVIAVTARAVMGQDLASSWLWLAAAPAALLGPLLGALVAAWQQERGALIGTVTAGIGALVLAAVTAGRRLSSHQGLPAVGLVAVMAIQIAVGLIGGLLGRRGPTAPTRAD